MDSRFDDLLHTVIVEKGQGIYGFFDVVFGFMYRRTDLFYEMAPGENMGFFPGQGESIVYNYYRKYQNLHYKERVPKRNIDPKEVEEFMKAQKEKSGNKPVEIKTELKENILGSNTTTTNSTDDKIEIKPQPKKENTTPITVTSIPARAKTETKVDEKFSSISTYNGDSCDNYNWSQGVMDVQIQIKLPDNTTKKNVR